MIRPVAFGFNSETASNNHYQKEVVGLSNSEVQNRALNEFDRFAEKLRAEGVNVLVFDDTLDPRTPDSIFPNNWVSFHENATVILYPMFAPNRRQERRSAILDSLRDSGFEIKTIIDLTDSEDENRYLEGTGSLVLDRENRIAYACISLRTDEQLLNDWAAQTNYEIVAFHAVQEVDGRSEPIYHTNVMMSVGQELAVVCAESIKNETERKEVLSTLNNTGKEIILITEDQKLKFAGNMLQVISNSGEKMMVMSSRAFNSLTEEQIDAIERTNRIVHSPLDTIETLGGGSARCMMAEVFLPSK